MQGKVKLLRRRGVRLSNRDITNEPELRGDLTLVGMASSYVLDLRDPNSQNETGLRARLYEARLVTMHGDKMLFRGEERLHSDEGPAFVQEWSVMVER